MGKTLTLEYKQQYVKDYEMYGKQYVMNKYNISQSFIITSTVTSYTKSIKTFAYPAFCDYCKNLSDEDSYALLKELKESNKFEFCLKYKIRYPISSGTLRSIRKRLGITYTPMKKNNVYTAEDHSCMYTHLLKYGIHATIKKVMAKYGISNSMARHIIQASREIMTGVLCTINNTLSDDEKRIVIDEYNTKGLDFIQKKYRYTTRASANAAIKKFCICLNIKYNSNTSHARLNKAYKLQMIKEYEIYGAKYVKEKYGYASLNTVRTAICKFKKQLEKLGCS